MFNVQTHTAPAVAYAVAETGKLNKATGNVASAMTAIFVAFMAADPTLSIKAVSTLVGEKVPHSKAGGVAAVHKSRANTFFSDDANAKAVREAFPNPEDMTPEAFWEGVQTYAKGINPRKWVDAQAAKKKEAAAAAKEAATEGARDESTLDVNTDGELVILNPGFDPVLDATNAALRAIALLRGMEQTDEVIDALYSIATATGVIAEEADIAQAA